MAHKKDDDINNNPTPEREPWTPWGKWAKRRRERIERRRREREERKRQRREAFRRRIRRSRLFLTRSIVFVGLGVFACLIGFLVILIIGRPYPWQTFNDVTTSIQALERLTTNQTRWESLAIEHYTIEVEYRQGGAICGPVELEIRNGEILNAPEPGDLWVPAEICDNQLSLLTVEGAFTQLNMLLEEFTPSVDLLRIEFDEEFGYIQSLRVDTYADEPTPNCCWQAQWRNLEPIYDSPE